MKYYRKKNTPFIRRLSKTRKNSTVNAIKFLLIVSVVVAFVIPYNIYFSTGNYTFFGVHSTISLLWFAVVVVIIFPISAKSKEPLLATKLKEYKRKILKRQSASNGSQGIKNKTMRIRLIKTGLLSIILLSFCVNTPVFQIHPFELKSFSIAGEDSVFRTGESVSFSWDLMGTPQKAYLVFGDGNIEDIVDYCSQINGMTYGSLEHRYSLQGKYTPILKVYYPGKTFSKNLDIWIENEAPLFSFAFNGEQPYKEGALRTSSSPFQVFEDEQVNFTVSLSKQTNQEGLTYQFNFGDHQVTSKENSTSYAWVNQGLYPVTITVIGSQGELSKQTQYVEVLNKAPQAAFKITNGLDFAVGKKIKFTAEGSSDTPSDKKNLRYVWDWGDGLMDYGKIVSHTYVEAGNYNVTLYVKDDDSLVSQISQIIEFDNAKPEIFLDDYNIGNNTLTVNEGEEVLFTAISLDDDKAIFKLLFYWNFESEEFDPSNLKDFELGGWKNRHVFEDDFEGTVSVAVIDSHGEYNSDYSDVRVINVAPQISVFDAKIFANVSFQVYRNDTAKEASFEFNLFRDDDFYGKSLLSFSDSGENLISSNDTTLGFSLLNQWKVIVNTTEVLPANSSFQAFINLVFINGQELVLSSNELFGGNYEKWEIDLSTEFYDEQNYSYKYPITIATQVFDPSIDEVQFSMSYQENKLLEISLSNALPISDAFTSQGIEYVIDIYKQDSKQFANITARKDVFSELFDNHSFPLKEELEVNINSLIDIYDLLQNNLGLLDLSIIDCLSADNFIDVYALDDDLGNSSLTIDFETKINIEMGNLTSFLTVSTSNYHGPTPFGKIGGFLSTAYEGEQIKFISKANDKDVSGMTFMWDFGDGNIVYSEHAEHAWRNAGIYNITLAMADPFGNIYYDVKSITVLPKAPEIVGPFAFQGTEGSIVTLDVEIYDTYKDANNLKYSWYDNKDNLVSSDRKPVLLLNDGTFIYTLVVIDPSGQSSSKDITVTIHSLSPEIYMSSYMYHGIEGDYRFNTDGKLELTAYGLDTLLDSEKLYFSWTIRNGKKIIRIGDGRYQLFSKVTFYCTETTTYQGEVRVKDPEGNEKVATFQIVSIIDSTLDGIDDETEEMLKLSDGSSDTDGDGLTDSYEMTVSNTSYLDPDTDGDLLWDGPTVNGSIGEQAVSTDPLDWDCDDDFLSDGTEFFGWNITVAYFENTTNFHVTSDSLDNDTDNDGLSDYDEYYVGSNPRQADTDNDGLTDDIDPFPTKWDGDGDLLSDYEEILRGTNYDNADSDQDGLKDGEEVYGWGIGFFTNPLDADSDHDHISDSAEIKNYLVKLQDEGFDDLDKKVNLSAPISLHFPHHFEQAVAAQISFGISFGEYGENATDSYGVANEDVQDLYVIITKKDNGVLIANFSTNNTRYFSQVVDVTSIMNNLSLSYDYYGDYEIGIGTPGGSYVQEGYYPGTYSFEDDEIGATGTDISYIDRYDSSGSSAYAKIIDEVNGHKNVVYFYDGSSSGNYNFHSYHDFDSNIESGTIEFWAMGKSFYATDKTGAYYHFGDTSGATSFNNLFIFAMDNDNDGLVRFYTGNGWQTWSSLYQDDTWHHVRIDFESTTGDYLGLGQYKVNFWFDGEELLEESPFAYDASLGLISVTSHGWDNTRRDYLDAMSFSWDPSYNIGDNEEELYHDYQFLNSGHYSGTYSFEDDTIGGHPEGWTVAEGSYTDIQVETEVGGHKNVLSVRDWGYSSSSATNVFDSGQAYGAAEWWFRAAGTSSNRRQDVRFGWSSLSDTYTCFRVWFDANIMYVQHSGGSTNAFTFTADTWYHLKFTWDSTSGGYDGNGQDQVSFYVDGVKKGTFTFWHHHDTVDKISIQTWGSSCRVNQKLYHDAFGFSWDPDYNIGDNLKDPLDAGCYLDYFELEFCRYLDPNDSDTDGDGILDGVEMGVLVEGTDVLNFTDIYWYNNLSVTSIGNFSATYSFEDESDGTTNTNIGFVDSVIVDSNCVATIVDEFEYHNKVLKLSDDNSNGKIYAYNTAFDRQNGTLEFWWAQTANNKDSICYLYDEGTGTALSLYMRSNGQYSWFDGSYHDVKEYSANTWYHNKIIFNCSEGSNGKFTWYIDGESEASDIDFRDNCQSLDKLLLGTDIGSNGFDAYFDAIGFAWNWTYWEGENFEEQLPDASGIGHYPGAFSFEDDEIGSTGTDISYIDRYDSSGSSAYAKIIDEVNGHKNIIYFYDGSSSGNYNFHSYHDFDSNIESGTIEFWAMGKSFYATDKTGAYYHFGDTSGATSGNFNNLFIFAMDNDNDGLVRFYTGNGWQTWSSLYQDNTWHHVRIDFESTTGDYLDLGQYKVNFWFDGEELLEDSPFAYDASLGLISVTSHGWDNTRRDYLDAMGFSWDTEYNVGDNINYESADLDEPDEYYLEIPQIGEVSDAQLDIKIESDGTPEGSGKVFVQLVKEEANLTRSDVSLIDYCGSFDSTQQFTYEKSIDLSPYVTSGQVYGTYFLKIQAFSTASTDIFNLTQFEIEMDTYIFAEFGDTEAWVTDPAEADTDGDNLSDYYEIFTGETNPTSVDTDGDDAWDDADRDPLRDVMLEIQPLYGQYDIYDPWPAPPLNHHPLMQIVINCSFVSEDYAIITPCEITTEVTSAYDNFYHRAYFTDFQYYINIDDDESAYDDEVIIPLQLWHVKRHLGQDDVLLAGECVGGIWYDFTDSATQTLYTAYNNHWVYVNFSLVAIEKANTFAIYDVNSTFTGRYHDREQGYSVIQLQIPDNGHYLGTESFLEEQIGANSTSIAFVDEDYSDEHSLVSIVGEIGGHTQVLCLQEGTDDHADIAHDFASSQTEGTIEWWWRTSDNDGIVYFKLQRNGGDTIRLYMMDGKIKYHDGSYHDVKNININTWYRMRIDFACKFQGIGIYEFDIYVDGVLEKSGASFYSSHNFVNNLRLYTGGDPFNAYFDAFGFSWDSNYDTGDNSQTYSVEGTPFEHGMNVIVIPTELFTHTLLNGYVENDNLDQTPLYHPDKNIFEFSAIERDGQPTQANADADLMFYRRSISPSDAMEVLELILKGLLNETWGDENATFIHSYICTKLNDTKATEMNLPYSVLGFIPWFNSYTNSKMGDEPLPSGGFDLFLWLLCLFNPILAESLHSQMAMSGGEFYKYLVGFTASILMSVMTFLGDLLWIIARVALLVFFYIILAIELLFISISILTLGLPLLIMSYFSDFEVEFNLNFSIQYSIEILAGFLSLKNSDNDIQIKKYITWKYWEFFDLYIPWIVSKTVIGNATISEERQDIFGNTEEIESDGFNNQVSGIKTPPILFNNTFCEVNSNEYLFRVTYKDVNFDTPAQNYGVKLHLIAPNGTTMDFLSMNCEGSSPDYSSALGVNYSLTVDFSSYEQGLWHYYFSTTDGLDNNITIYPYIGYFMGPITSNTSYFLWQNRVTTNNFYTNPEGWADQDFNFYVSWWDMVNSTEPENIYLCLMPANVTLGTGVNKTVGIQKFQMQTVESNPNFTSTVEYEKSINFTSLGYTKEQLGWFLYYFEAEVFDGSIALGLEYSEDNPYYPSVLVKTIESPVLKINFRKLGSSSSLQDIVTDGSTLEFTATYTDCSTTEPENITILFSNIATGEVFEYNMTKYYSAVQGDEHKYFLFVDGASIACGSWVVDIDVVNSQSDTVIYSKGFDSGNFVLTVLGNVLEGMNTFGNVINFFGFLPMVSHILSLMLVISGHFVNGAHGRALTIAGNLLAITTTIVALTAAICQFVYLIQDIGNNLPQLIGFAIGCMFIFLFYGLAATAFKRDKGPCDWIAPNVKAKQLLDMQFIFTKGLSLVLTFVSIASLLLGLFFSGGPWDLIFGFASAGFRVVRNSILLIAMSLMLGIILGFIGWRNSGIYGGGAEIGYRLDQIDTTYIKSAMFIYAGGMFVLGLVAFIIIGQQIIS